MARTAASLLVIVLSAATIQSAQLPRGEKWAAVWAASVHGPYPSGNPVAQPVLDRVFEPPDRGARDQTLRLIVRPGAWGAQARLRFSNVFGTQAVTLDDLRRVLDRWPLLPMSIVSVGPTTDVHSPD